MRICCTTRYQHRPIIQHISAYSTGLDWHLHQYSPRFCSSSSQERIPRRLIYLSETDNETPRLIYPTQWLRYVALSHCWGESKPLSTTKVNEAARHLGIPSSQIPKTFQDAIRVTRWLGLQYLWIDSICIVQDDKADWETESSKVADM